jgi:DNA-binding response OmpR family regulator
MTQALIVGEDHEVVTVSVALRKAGYTTDIAPSVADALHEVLVSDIPLIVLFDDAPAITGEDSVPLLRRFTDAPLVVIGPPGEDRLVRALLEGADTYIHSPVDERELLARVNSLFRRNHTDTKPGIQVPTNGDKAKVHVRQTNGNGPRPRNSGFRMLELSRATTPVESRLLQCLTSQPGATVPSQDLLSAVWGSRGNASLLRFYIKRLRDRLKSLVDWQIVTVRGLGYRLDLTAPASST